MGYERRLLSPSSPVGAARAFDPQPARFVLKPCRRNYTRRRVSFCAVSEQLDLTIVYEPGENGQILAPIPQVAGVFSQGRTREEARANVIDALRLMLSPEPISADDQLERERLHLTITA
jgi:predicted RNase H-like HicB family nuclease